MKTFYIYKLKMCGVEYYVVAESPTRAIELLVDHKNGAQKLHDYSAASVASVRQLGEVLMAYR